MCDKEPASFGREGRRNCLEMVIQIKEIPVSSLGPEGFPEIY